MRKDSCGYGPLADFERELLDGNPVVTTFGVRYVVTTTMGAPIGSFTQEEWDGGAAAAFKALNNARGINYSVVKHYTQQTVTTTFQDFEDTIY